ncbi:MAG: holo-ACP synthase [Betaproteobacteria bacterium]|nr:holo-ACP synthase [Betaproteobacteria bacterium]
MIFGIGTDIVAVERFEGLLARHGQRVARRILSAAELHDFADSPHPARFLARRFAAKEAFSKALGTGVRTPVTLRGVGVGHDALGKPCLDLAPQVAALMQGRGLVSHLSISDEAQFAVAFVVLETAPGKSGA